MSATNATPVNMAFEEEVAKIRLRYDSIRERSDYEFHLAAPHDRAIEAAASEYFFAKEYPEYQAVGAREQRIAELIREYRGVCRCVVRVVREMNRTMGQAEFSRVSAEQLNEAVEKGVADWTRMFMQPPQPAQVPVDPALMNGVAQAFPQVPVMALPQPAQVPMDPALMYGIAQVPFPQVPVIADAAPDLQMPPAQMPVFGGDYPMQPQPFPEMPYEQVAPSIYGAGYGFQADLFDTPQMPEMPPRLPSPMWFPLFGDDLPEGPNGSANSDDVQYYENTGAFA